jgi:hypothetical protein
VRTIALFCLLLFSSFTPFRFEGSPTAGPTEEVLSLHPMNANGNKDRMFIRYSNTRIGDLSIRILNAAGGTVKEYMDLGVPKGFHTALLDLSEMESGKYYIKLILEDETGQRFLSEGIFLVDNE